MIKAGEYKNVCKAVNDRKLAELKKEIIEILKKQDEKEFKKATDYLNSQEEHFTHLEKSFSGKWIEKAGYGIGTVRVWKGKKYKKIAPNKWVRVFDKEGRGTNIAIGKLIAKVNKIDNVEDLMAFVMQNKQHFVDENGNDLPILDKLRAEIDIKNETLSGESSSYIYGVGENVSREKNKLFEGKDRITKEEADLHKVSRKFEQIPTTELKQRKAKLERWIENKTRNKRDSLNNAIFRESYQKELDAINEVLDKRNGNMGSKGKESESYYSAKENKIVNKKQELLETYKKTKNSETESGKKLHETTKQILQNNYGIDPDENSEEKPAEKKTVAGVKIFSKDEIHNLTKGEVQDYRKELHDAMKKLDYGDDDFDILYATKKIADDTWNNKEYKGAVDSDKNIEQFAKYLKENNLHQHDKIEYKGKEYVIDYDSQGGDKDLLWIPPVFDDPEFDVKEIKIKTEKEDEIDEDIKNKAIDKIKKYAGKKINSNPIEITKIEDDGKRSGFLTFEFKSDNDTYKMTYDYGFGGEEGGTSIKKIESEETEAEKTQNRSDAMKGNKNAYKGGSEKVELGTFTKIDDKTVEMPSDKVSKQLFENLNKSRSDDNTREFMTDCYYDGENIVSTDGKRMTIIKAENIGLEPGYVSVKTDGGKIRLESIEKKDLRTSFPNYKGVMPTKNNQEVKFDNKALTEKLKEMKKEGKYTKAEPQIALEFEDGKVMLDGVQIGSADGVKFNDSNQRMVINANFLKDALTSGDTSSMFVSDNPNKAMVIKTDVSDSVVMPYRNEMKTEYEVHPDKARSDTESKPDIKSMPNDELKEYEAKLEKELLEMGNRNSPDYMKKYSEWREVHAENNDRFHQGIEDEARAEKQKEADAKAEKEKEIKEKYNGYFDNRFGLDKARDVKLLEKKYNFDGKVMSQKDFVEQAIDGGAEIKEREVNKLDYPSRTRWNRMNGYEQEQYERRIKEAGKKTLYSINGFEFPKSVVDYAKYYKENGKKGSDNEKSSLSDVGIKNRASSIASAVSYSKDYQKKMGVPFSLETAEVSVDDADDMDEATKKAVKEELRRIYDEKKVKKSLFDDFIIDVFEADEDEEIEDAIKFDETEYNDYSAEQPELFNSVEFAVREALNRRHNCIM